MNQKPATFRDYEVSFTDDYRIDEPLGRELRRANAKLLLQAMDQKEISIAQQLENVAAVENRVFRSQEQHRLDMQYLIEFGVITSHRNEFRRILEEVTTNGGMRLQAAAELAYARSTPLDQSSKEELSGAA